MNDRIKILIVEDNQDRINWFEKEFADAELVIAKDANEGIKSVVGEKFDIIFLDHDLGDRGFVDSNDPNTGYQVAKTIKASKYNHTTLVIIHSWNEAGSKNMQSILPNAACFPFGTFTRSIIKTYHGIH